MLRSNVLENNIINNNPSRGLFPWLLRRKESSWSLRSFSKMNRLGSFSSSTVSLPLSIASSTASSCIIPSQPTEVESDDDDEQVEEPPTYDDKSHPWTFQFPKSLSNRTIVPREEEGHESLPDYECTIEKMSYVKVKCEYTQPNVKSKSRTWRYFYIQIYGTKIMAHITNPVKKTKKNILEPPVWTHSMLGAEASVATDYLKERHVIRLKIHKGPQYLITVLSEKDKQDWMASIETSKNISSDLDTRDMPTFITLLHRNPRRRAAHAAVAVTNSSNNNGSLL